jgi:hypothetical protein
MILWATNIALAAILEDWYFNIRCSISGSSIRYLAKFQSLYESLYEIFGET